MTHPTCLTLVRREAATVWGGPRQRECETRLYRRTTNRPRKIQTIEIWRWAPQTGTTASRRQCMLALPGRLFLRPTTLRKVFDKTLAARRLPARCMSTKENSPYEANKKPKTDMADLLRVKKISEHATLPVRGSDGAAGYDLASAYDYVVPARGKELVKTDLSIAIPKVRVNPPLCFFWFSVLRRRLTSTEPSSPAGHLRAHRPQVRTRVEALHRHRRGRRRLRLPRQRRRHPVQPRREGLRGEEG